MNTTLTIYTDGGSRGNPGPAAYGFVIYDASGVVIYEEGKRLGETTNNVAEYMGVLASLQWVEGKYTGITINYFMDSLLIASQLSGKFQIKSSHLREIYTAIKKLEYQLDIHSTYSQIPRAKNKEADRLVNEALDFKR